MTLKPHRFMRTEALIGSEGLNKIKNSTVMVVGLGAVGGYAVEALARSGIGKMILIDFDIVDITNINRQIYALTSTIGEEKYKLAEKRVKDINPDCEIIAKKIFVNNDTIKDVIAMKPDYVIDAIDSLNPKCCLIQALVENNINFISSMGAALRTDPSFIQIGKLNQTKNCNLSRLIRKRMKKREIDMTKVRCVFSTEKMDDLPENAIFENNSSQQEAGRIRNIMGSMPTITAIFGLTIANQVIWDLIKE